MMAEICVMMAVTELWLIFFAFSSVVGNVRQDQAIRTEVCSMGDKILNDCNWCRCHEGQFDCDERNCKMVDKFGHFNDAIRDIDVGMEGHGTWRSMETACQPSVAYRRGALLCICDENGEWPNPTCRDVFRVLHSVEITKDLNCTPTKLYLLGCNVCVCPNTGRLNSELCTKNKCHENDPVLKTRSEPEHEDTQNDGVLDVYADCEVNKKYQLGCKTCTCLRNNRLLCGDCTKTNDKDRHYCKSVAPNVMFHVDCNLCFCDEKGRMVCSVKRCLGTVPMPTRRRLMDIDERYFELVDRPIDLHTCKLGTKYRKGCNTCICLEHDSRPMFACSVRSCKNETSIRTIREGCVLHTTYELNCLLCSCVLANNEKWQWCEVENRCSNIKSESTDLSTMHGYCEPLHNYFQDCNSCQCLSDGQSAVCSDDKCDQQALAVEIVPMLQHGSNCPRGKAYKVDCNICYCLLNGNSLCTTLDCEKN